jgi:hypothetical protein
MPENSPAQNRRNDTSWLFGTTGNQQRRSQVQRVASPQSVFHEQPTRERTHFLWSIDDTPHFAGAFT